MASGCANWLAFQGIAANVTQSTRWQAEIDRQWSTLNANERQRVQAYAARWGPNQRPQLPNLLHEDYAREHCWRTNRAVPKCNSCWAGNDAMPRADMIPIGLDNEDLVPVWEERQNTANRRISKMNRSVRDCFVKLFVLLLGPNNVTWANMTSRTNFRNSVVGGLALDSPIWPQNG
ncbi:hypothetical protein B0A49_11633 [Cryomyces minteri]|uniref:Uncharacterized protein n=1 Tax=Cryomyces minteri TaxID=331657 RepID=A0A4U0WT19_9PEZI|nr:hypothetical protein B0A49_11633 [Cryomyces minteri]